MTRRLSSIGRAARTVRVNVLLADRKVLVRGMVTAQRKHAETYANIAHDRSLIAEIDDSLARLAEVTP